MYLWHIFTVKPLAALSILLCLATILSCVFLERRRPHLGADRFLIGFLGLLSIYQGMRILQSAGIMAHGPTGKVDDAIEVAVTAFYLLATVMLRFSSIDHLQAESAMRLVRAAPPRSQLRSSETERDLARIHWALTRLSDSAFRLYAYLCLRQDQAVGVSPADIRLRLGKSREQLDRDLIELETSGAVYLTREDGRVGITIVAQPAPQAAPAVLESIPQEAAVHSGL